MPDIKGKPNIVGYEHLTHTFKPRYQDDLYPWVRDDNGNRWHRADVSPITLDYMRDSELDALREIGRYPAGILLEDLSGHGIKRVTTDKLVRLRLLDFGRRMPGWARAYTITDKGRKELESR